MVKKTIQLNKQGKKIIYRHQPPRKHVPWEYASNKNDGEPTEDKRFRDQMGLNGGISMDNIGERPRMFMWTP